MWSNKSKEKENKGESKNFEETSTNVKFHNAENEIIPENIISPNENIDFKNVKDKTNKNPFYFMQREIPILQEDKNHDSDSNKVKSNPKFKSSFKSRNNSAIKSQDDLKNIEVKNSFVNIIDKKSMDNIGYQSNGRAI